MATSRRWRVFSTDCRRSRHTTTSTRRRSSCRQTPEPPRAPRPRPARAERGSQTPNQRRKAPRMASSPPAMNVPGKGITNSTAPTTTTAVETRIVPVGFGETEGKTLHRPAGGRERRRGVGTNTGSAPGYRRDSPAGGARDEQNRPTPSHERRERTRPNTRTRGRVHPPDRARRAPRLDQPQNTRRWVRRARVGAHAHHHLYEPPDGDGPHRVSRRTPTG